MKDNMKELYFCHTHTNLFSQKLCNECRRGMCHTCINNHSTLCDGCLKLNYLGNVNNPYKKEFFWMSISGGITLVLYLIVDFSSNSEKYFFNNLYSDSLIAFLFGAGIIATNYFMRDKEFLGKTGAIPFIGFKLSLIFIAIIFISGIPIIYIAYKFMIFFVRSFRFNNHKLKNQQP